MRFPLADLGQVRREVGRHAEEVDGQRAVGKELRVPGALGGEEQGRGLPGKAQPAGDHQDLALVGVKEVAVVPVEPGEAQRQGRREDRDQEADVQETPAVGARAGRRVLAGGACEKDCLIGRQSLVSGCAAHRATPRGAARP